MIYFFENIEPFVTISGMNIHPIEVGYFEGKKVFGLSDFWREEIEAQGVLILDINSIEVERINVEP